jgi:hypothetical protein
MFSQSTKLVISPTKIAYTEINIGYLFAEHNLYAILVIYITIAAETKKTETIELTSVSLSRKLPNQKY